MPAPHRFANFTSDMPKHQEELRVGQVATLLHAAYVARLDPPKVSFWERFKGWVLRAA